MGVNQDPQCPTLSSLAAGAAHGWKDGVTLKAASGFVINIAYDRSGHCNRHICANYHVVADIESYKRKKNLLYKRRLSYLNSNQNSYAILFLNEIRKKELGLMNC